MHLCQNWLNFLAIDLDFCQIHNSKSFVLFIHGFQEKMVKFFSNFIAILSKLIGFFSNVVTFFLIFVIIDCELNFVKSKTNFMSFS